MAGDWWHLSAHQVLALLLVPLMLGSCAGNDTDEADLPVLTANTARQREQLHIGKQTRRYLLQGLRPGTSYEARLSHPASIPVRVWLQIGSRSTQLLLTRRRHRRLLDCDKVIFKVDADGTVQGQAEPVLLVAATHSSVHRDGPRGGTQMLIYNLVVQELLLGIPTDTFPVILVIIALIGIVALLLPWWVDTAVPALEHFLQGPEAAASDGEPPDQRLSRAKAS